MGTAGYRTVATILIAFLTLFASAPHATAAPDQTKIIVSTAAPKITRSLVPLTTSFVRPEIPLRIEFGRKNRIRAQSYILSDFTGQFTRQSAAVYGSALALRADPQYKRLPSNTLQPLDTQWVDTSQSRALILSSCQSLDGRDVDLKGESESIDAQLADHARRSSDLKTAMLSWNSRCAGQAPTQDQYDACQAERSQLESSRNELNQEVAALNDVIADHNAKMHQMQTDVSSAEDQWNAWASEIQSLINSIKAAFAKKMLRCDYVAKGTNGRCIYNCEKLGVIYMMEDLSDGGCSNPRYIPDDGSGGVGATRIKPENGGVK